MSTYKCPLHCRLPLVCVDGPGKLVGSGLALVAFTFVQVLTGTGSFV